MSNDYYIAELKTPDGQFVGTIFLTKKRFSSGSQGFFGTAKISEDGDRYQCQGQMVRIGSKHEGEEE